MLSADYRAAKALMEVRVEKATRHAGEAMHEQLSPQVRVPGRWLLRRLAFLLVALGARLVRYGLPPYRPAGVELSRGEA